MASESDDATDPPHGTTAQTDTELRAAPHHHQVLHEDPATLSLWGALRYILSIRTNLALILASALGYFYFAGLQTFAIIYFHGRYGLSQSASTNVLVLAGLGAIVGLSLTGRIADALSKRQFAGARPAVAGAAFLLCAVLLSVALLVDSLALTLPLLFLAAARPRWREPTPRCRTTGHHARPATRPRRKRPHRAS